MKLTWTQQKPYDSWTCDQDAELTIGKSRDWQGREQFHLCHAGFNIRTCRTFRGAQQAARVIAREWEDVAS